MAPTSSKDHAVSDLDTRMCQLVRYFGTAGAAAMVDIGLFVVLVKAGFDVAPGAALSFLIATVVNYLLTARLVFGQPAGLRGYGRFLVAASAGFVINVGVTLAIVGLLGISPTVAKVVGVGTAFLVNFALNAVFVFPSRHESVFKN